MSKQDELISQYAAKFAAETLGCEPPTPAYPSDESLLECLSRCVRLPAADDLPTIRLAFLETYGNLYRSLLTAPF